MDTSDTNADIQQQSESAQPDGERQRKAREYTRTRQRLGTVNLLIACVGLIVIFAARLHWALRDWLHPLNWQPVAGWYPAQILVYLLILMVAYQIITAPLSYYRGFVIPHRYGLSTMSLKSWLGDVAKNIVLNLIFVGFAVELVYLLLATQPQLWWLWVGLIFLFFTVLMANLAPVLLLPLFYKFRPLPEGELTRRLLALSDRAHTRVRGVFSMEMSNKTTATNAALMGLGNTRRIVLGDTMLDRYTNDEIEVVLAHELGHHVHHDLWKLMISQSASTLVGLYLVNLVLHWAVDARHAFLSLSDPATLPFIIVLTSLFGLIVLPISNGISRAIEYQADEYALQATKMVGAFKSAMTRLANQNLTVMEPSPLNEFFFYNHPSYGKRLRHADTFAQRNGYAFNASITAESLPATSSTEPLGIPSNGSSTPNSPH